VYRCDGTRWESRPLPDVALQVWALAIDRRSPTTLFAGCRPLALLRSDDAGDHWTVLDLVLRPEVERPHTARVTAVLVDGGATWAGVEVGGVFVSDDGGRHFVEASAGLPSLDVHALARSNALLAATPRGIARHDGEAWHDTALDAPWRYCRALAVHPAPPRALLCGLGDGPPGGRGAVVMSDDDGRSWRPTAFPGIARSTIWSVAVTPADPDLAFAGAFGGELFASTNGGRSWRRLPREFPEVRAVCIA
jgi:photosystem II stability/assembly factor-like uncharacterized protein